MSDLRRESSRRQLDLLVLIRDRMDKESDDDYEAWAIALTPLTDRVIRELMGLEGSSSLYEPCPMAAAFFYVAADPYDDGTAVR